MSGGGRKRRLAVVGGLMLWVMALWLAQARDSHMAQLPLSRAAGPVDFASTAVGSADANQPEHEYAAAGLPITPTHSDGHRLEEPGRPHPITSAHERIYRENNLIGALNLAVDSSDAPRIRELVATYRPEYPQDAHVLQEGYAIIADCLDDLDDATRERARTFWQTQIRSQTRRYVRRHCLSRAPRSSQ